MKCAFFTLTTLLFCSSAMALPPDGEALFQENCSACHGPRGMGGSAPKLAGDASEWKSKTFERAVLNGVDDHGKPLKAPMPHWSGASFKADNGAKPSKLEVDAIQQYLHKQK
ncbi:cytochrome C [Pseudomonas frederiksbergensis]|uniref:Cytochrome C n=1 Tax=Pseudomonas frederiksbergensis TaxID=104087 RepID=A0A1J0EGZ3_9PSED|nr:cytochrome c [Pseudomonas frederiksbergensis]APC15084.1 cytochrome C [Pseudomonas frederiksbergensis]